MVGLKDKIQNELKTDNVSSETVVSAINGMKDEDIRQVLFGIIDELKILQKRVTVLEEQK